MIKLHQLLSRADDETLAYLIGDEAMRLLLKLDPKLATPSNLREIAISLHSASGLLVTKDYRSRLFDLLKPDEVLILANILQISPQSDIYSALKNTRFLRGSDREKALFDFFEVVKPEEAFIEEIPSLKNNDCRYPLFAHQRHAIKEVQAKLVRHPYRVLLHMPTGAGKTRTTMNIITEHLRLNEPTLVIWLAHTEELCEQSASEFETAWSFLGNRSLQVWRFWGSHELNPTEITDGILVAGLSKTYSATKERIQFIVELGRRASLVIIDEAHSAIAPTYKTVLGSLHVQGQKTALLGLTATPGRTWSDIVADEALADFFGRQKVTLKIEGFANPVDYLVSEQYLAKVSYRSLFYKSGLQLSEADKQQVRQHLDIPDKVLKFLADDEMRNLAIITATEQLLKKHRRILLFATTVEHSNLIASILRIRGIKAHSITGNTSKRLRAQIIEDFKSNDPIQYVLCNFGVLTTGFDAPQTSAALIARPTKSLVLYSQMIGRAIRGLKAGGNAEAEIITVVDNQLPGFGSVAEAFNNWEDIWE